MADAGAGQHVVPARAAVAAVNLVARNSDSAANDTFRAKAKVEMAAALGLLPPGVSAAAIGASALVPHAHHWAESGLGARQDVRFRAPIWTYQLLFWAGRERPFGDREELPGPVDIPVWADPATGRIVEVDVDRLVAELEPQFELAREIYKEEDAPMAPVRTVLRGPKLAKGFLKKMKDEITDVVGDIRAIGETGAPPTDQGPRPDDGSHPPIEGVGYQAWVCLRGGLVMDRVHPTHLEVYVTHRGVPPGRWAAIDAAWESRTAADTRLAVWRAYDIGRMSPLGARWEVGA
jgi:hypothetical protein